MSSAPTRKSKLRRAATSIRVNPKVRAMRVYPVEGTAKTIDELQSVGIKLSREQAIHLARVLLAVSQEWDEVEITAYRLEGHPERFRRCDTRSDPSIDAAFRDYWGGRLALHDRNCIRYRSTLCSSASGLDFLRCR